MSTPFDVRQLAGRERGARVLEAFDALAPGAAMCLLIDHPKPMLLVLQAERAGAFDWHLLDGGPGEWRIEVVRRREPSSRAALDYLLYDHRRLLWILNEADAAIDADRFGQAGARFAEFVCGLDRHADFEEHLLFPFFTEATGDPGLAVEEFRAEHNAIRAAVAVLAAAVTGRDAVAWHQTFRGLCDRFAAHEAREELILGPWMDPFADACGGAEALVQRLLCS